MSSTFTAKFEIIIFLWRNCNKYLMGFPINCLVENKHRVFENASIAFCLWERMLWFSKTFTCWGLRPEKTFFIYESHTFASSIRLRILCFCKQIFLNYILHLLCEVSPVSLKHANKIFFWPHMCISLFLNDSGKTT